MILHFGVVNLPVSWQTPNIKDDEDKGSPFHNGVNYFVGFETGRGDPAPTSKTRKSTDQRKPFG
jgi:hypothetical protein